MNKTPFKKRHLALTFALPFALAGTACEENEGAGIDDQTFYEQTETETAGETVQAGDRMPQAQPEQRATEQQPEGETWQPAETDDLGPDEEGTLGGELDQAAEQTGETKDKVINELNQRLNTLDREIDRLESRAAEDQQHTVQAVKLQRDQLEKQIEVLRSKSQSAWNNLDSEVEKGINNLESQIQQVEDSLKE